MSRSCRYQAVVSYNNYFRGFSSQAEMAAVPIASSIFFARSLCFNNLTYSNLLHRSASSSGGGRSINYYGRHQSNYFKQSGQRKVFLEIALFSSALYGATTSIVSADATNESTTLCSSNNNSSENNDEDFISKITAKINSQSLTDLSSSLPTTLDEALSTIGSQAQLALNSGIPTNLSYGFFAGYMSGFALKKIGRVASLTFGVGFVLLQTLAYHGYVDVNHDKLAKEIEGVLDRNGDGVVDGEDLKGVNELRRVVGFGIEGNEKGGDNDDGSNDQVKAIAGGGGFGMGFLGGLRSG